MLRSSDIERLRQDALLAQRNSRWVLLRIPTLSDCPACGYDEFSQSGYDSQCATCHGRGKVSTWREYRARPRIEWTTEGTYTPLATAGIKPGDVLIHVSPRERTLFEEVQGEPEAYVEVDGVHVRPTDIRLLTLGQVIEIAISCDRVKET